MTNPCKQIEAISTPASNDLNSVSELYWKLLRRILETKGEEVFYPKDVLRAAYRGKLIDNEEQWLGMLIDRNQISHTYNEKLADEIYNRIKVYYPFMHKTFQKLTIEFRSQP